MFVSPNHHPPCPVCGQATERLWTRGGAAVRQDEFIGGLTLENIGDQPVTVYSRSELKRELNARGLEECVRHVPVPGTDSSPFTTRWDVPSQYTLDQAKALLERVGTISPPVKEARGGVGPFATPQMVKEVADRWRS